MMKSRKHLIAFIPVLLIIGLSYAQPPSYLPTNGLVAWYPFNGNANEYFSNSTPSLINASFGTDRFNQSGTAISFSGNVLAKYNGSSPLTRVGNEYPNFTFNFWVNSGNGNGVLFGGFGWGYMVSMDGGFVMLRTVQSVTGLWTNTVISSPIPNNTWKMITISKIGENVKIWVNGALSINNNVINGSLGNYAQNNSWFGANGQDMGGFFLGKLDDVAIWNRVLTEDEISTLYNAIPCTLNTVSQPSSNPSVCSNSPMDPILIQTTGATGIGTPSGLPIGVSANWANNVVTLTGTPISSGNYNYTIPLTGGCGYVNASGSIIVNAANTASAPSSSPSICLNSSIVPIEIPTTGATGIGTPTNLPAGISASWSNNTITITGNANNYGDFQYSIPLLGGCGNISATGSITVFPPSNNSTSSSTSIPYQAELRDTNGEIVPNTPIDLRFTLHELTSDGAVSYEESHALSTNELGLFSASIGSGLAIEGCYNSIDWKQLNKFLQVEVNMGNGWITMGNQQLMSVPFSIIAQKAMQFETQNLPVFENNTQATNGGLQPGALYRTSIGDLKVVY